jgi:uncharacterized protein YkwD
MVTTKAAPESRTGSIVRRGLLLLLASLILLVPAPRAGAVSEEESTFARMVNAVRDRRGLADLRLTERLSSIARKHTHRMASRGDLFHSNLRRTFRAFPYRMVAENVGYAGSLDQLLQAFRDSRPHRRTLLGDWRTTGVGVEWRDGRVWLTQVFYA